MKKQLSFYATLGMVFTFFFLLSYPASASPTASSWRGYFLFGYRFVETSGASYKYREDVNLERGARLFNLSFQYLPEENSSNWFDSFSLSLQNYGGDPFETLTFSIGKSGRYDFQYERKKASYFYHDLYSTAEGVYDHHTFDFDRRTDTGKLRLFLTRQLNLNFSYERFTRQGKATPTLDINRVEFEFHQPYEEDSKKATINLTFNTRPFSLVLEESIQDYDFNNSFYLPGYADGGPAARYPSSLSYFSLNQPLDLRSYTHGLKFNIRPFSSLLISGSTQFITWDMNLNYEEVAQGTDYLGWLFSYKYQGEGKLNRDLNLYDFSLSWLLSKRIALMGSFYYHQLKQDGSMSLPETKEEVNFGYDNFGATAGLKIAFGSRLNLTFGLRQESRRLKELETATYEKETRQSGFFGNVHFEPSRKFRLTLDYQRAEAEEPFTLISSTMTNRFRLHTQLRWTSLQITGSYLVFRSESKVFVEEWQADRDQARLNFTYKRGSFQFSGGMTLIDIKKTAERTVAYPPFWTGPAGSFPWPIQFSGKSRLYDLGFDFQLSSNWLVKGSVERYTNRGFWPLDRTLLKAAIEYSLPHGYILKASYKFWDHGEKLAGANNFQASIFELSFGARWE